MEKIRNYAIVTRYLIGFLMTLFCQVQLIAQSSYRCTASKLNIRDTADQSGKVIGKISQNDTVDIISLNDDWGMIILNGDTGYVSIKYMESLQPVSKASRNVAEPWTDKQKAVFWLCFAIAVGIYIFAIVRVRRGEMVVIKGWLDFGLLVFPWLVVIAHFWDAFYGHMIFGKYVLIALYIIAALCLLGSLALSVIANWGSPFNIIFSLIMKLVVIPIMAFGVFYFIFKILDENGISRKSIIVFLILGILIGGLMSFEE